MSRFTTRRTSVFLIAIFLMRRKLKGKSQSIFESHSAKVFRHKMRWGGYKGKKENFPWPTDRHCHENELRVNTRLRKECCRHVSDHDLFWVCKLNINELILIYNFSFILIDDVIREYSVSLSQITVTASDAVLSWFYITFLWYPVVLGGRTVN